MRLFAPVLATFAASLSLLSGTAAQSAPGTVQLNPNAVCPYPTSDVIVQCLAKVEQDEAQRSGGPCNDGDWPCICNVSHTAI